MRFYLLYTNFNATTHQKLLCIYAGGSYTFAPNSVRVRVNPNTNPNPNPYPKPNPNPRKLLQ